MDDLDDFPERERFVEVASSYLANLEYWEAQHEEGKRIEPTDGHRALMALLKELRAKYPNVRMYGFRGWLFNPVRIDALDNAGKPLVLDFVQVVNEQAIYDVEE